MQQLFVNVVVMKILLVSIKLSALNNKMWTKSAESRYMKTNYTICTSVWQTAGFQKFGQVVMVTITKSLYWLSVTFKVIQGWWFPSHLKGLMSLPI